MSNMRVSQGSNLPPVSSSVNVQPTQPSVSDVPVKDPEIAQKVYQKEGQQLGPQEHFDLHEEQAVLEHVIDHLDEKALQQQALEVPPLNPLEKVKASLKPTITVDKSQGDFAKTEFLNDTKVTQDNKLEAKPMEPVHQRMSDKRLGENLVRLEQSTQLAEVRSRFSVSLQTARRQVDGQLKAGLGDVFNVYESSTRTLFGSKTDKQAEENLAQQVQNWVKDQGQESDLVNVLQTLSSVEVEDLARHLLKDLKGYSTKDMQNLSERKQAFVRIVAENLCTAAQGAKPGDGGNPRTIQDNLNTIQSSYSDLLQGIGGMKSQVGCELMLRSDEEVLRAVNTQMKQSNVLLNKAMLAGINQGLGGKVSEKTALVSVGTENVQVPEQIEINGKTYTQPKYLASGGFADIIAYTNPNAPHDKVVLKQLHTRLKENRNQVSILEMRKEAAQELLNQIEIEGVGGHGNLNSLTGAIRGENNQLYIVQDMADGGSLSEVNSKLWALQDNKVLPTDVKQLLTTHLMKGVLQGMDHIQNERQGHHFDLKLPNILLGSDGEAKITDFGFSGLGDSKLAKNLQGNDNALYKSPEFIDSMTKDKFVDQIKQRIKSEGMTVFEDMNRVDVLDPGEGKHLRKIKQQAGEEAYEFALAERNQKKRAYLDRVDEVYAELLSNVQVNSRADTWNVGVTALELFTMKKPSEYKLYHDFGDLFEENIINFGKNNDNRMAQASRIGGEEGKMGMGITAVDKLINGLMHPDPEQRTNFKSALNNSLFKDERLDKPEVGQLLLKISKLDPQNISESDRSEIQHLVSALRV